MEEIRKLSVFETVVILLYYFTESIILLRSSFTSNLRESICLELLKKNTFSTTSLCFADIQMTYDNSQLNQLKCNASLIVEQKDYFYLINFTNHVTTVLLNGIDGYNKILPVVSLSYAYPYTLIQQIKCKSCRLAPVMLSGAWEGRDFGLSGD